MVTDRVCDPNNIRDNQQKNPLVAFCADQINSDGLLDLIAQFGDYEKKTSNQQPACLYYGITSRQMKLQDNDGIALGP